MIHFVGLRWYSFICFNTKSLLNGKKKKKKKTQYYLGIKSQNAVFHRGST